MCVAKIARYVKKRCATTSGALCGPVGVVQEGRQRGEIPLGPGSGKWEIPLRYQEPGNREKTPEIGQLAPWVTWGIWH